MGNQRDQQGGTQQGANPKTSDASQGARDENAGRQQGQQNVYGEGNYAASKQYNDATRDFVKSGRVDEAARDAAPQTDADEIQMAAAEAEGKRHAKEEDPALERKRSGLAPDTSQAPKPGGEE
jgi:hypothetical protein